jgi:hypothetical protein
MIKPQFFYIAEKGSHKLKEVFCCRLSNREASRLEKLLSEKFDVCHFSPWATSDGYRKKNVPKHEIPLIEEHENWHELSRGLIGSHTIELRDVYCLDEPFADAISHFKRLVDPNQRSPYLIQDMWWHLDCSQAARYRKRRRNKVKGAVIAIFYGLYPLALSILCNDPKRGKEILMKAIEIAKDEGFERAKEFLLKFAPASEVEFFKHFENPLSKEWKATNYGRIEDVEGFAEWFKRKR